MCTGLGRTSASDGAGAGGPGFRTGRELSALAPWSRFSGQSAGLQTEQERSEPRQARLSEEGSWNSLEGGLARPGYSS